MTKEALKLALEALVLNNAEWKHLADSGDSGYWSVEDQNHYKQTEQAITAVQRVLANEALEKMAENARELGLDYEPEQEPWVGLTDEDLEAEFGFIDELLRDTCYRTEAKLKAKNVL